MDGHVNMYSAQCRRRAKIYMVRRRSHLIYATIALKDLQLSESRHLLLGLTSTDHFLRFRMAVSGQLGLIPGVSFRQLLIVCLPGDSCMPGRSIQQRSTCMYTWTVMIMQEKTLASGGVEAQTDQALKNMGEILKEAGLSYDDVVKTTILLADISDFGAVNAVYGASCSLLTIPRYFCNVCFSKLSQFGRCKPVIHTLYHLR